MQLWNGSVSDSVTARLKQDKKCCLFYIQCNTDCGYGWCAHAAAAISTKLTNGLGRGKKAKVFHVWQKKTRNHNVMWLKERWSLADLSLERQGDSEL